MSVSNVRNVDVFDSTDSVEEKLYVEGVGSIFTYIASGVAGQSATVEGSADGKIWVQIVTLTIDAGKTVEETTKQNMFAYLRITGTARLQICRGAA